MIGLRPTEDAINERDGACLLQYVWAASTWQTETNALSNSGIAPVAEGLFVVVRLLLVFVVGCWE